MKYADDETPPHRHPDHLKEILDAMMKNRRSFSETDQGPFVTDSIRYTYSKQKRHKQTEATIDDERSQRIAQLFDFEKPIAYQHKAWQSLGGILDTEDRSTDAALVTAPTGFGKTEAFLGPLLDALAEGSIENIALVYPRTALLRDQLGRVLKAVRHLNDTRDADLSVGPYYGDTPFFTWKVPTDYRLVDRSGALKMTNCWCGEEGEPDPAFILEDANGDEYTVTCTNDDHSFTSDEFVLSRQAMKDDPPNIFITTLQSLETSCLKTNYHILEALDTIVVDEVHLYQGIYGSHAARIFQNLRRIKQERYDGAPFFIGASATLDSPKRFASKMFGTTRDAVSVYSPSPEQDFRDPKDVKGTENYYFVLSSDDVSLATTFIQQGMLFGHTQLESADEEKDRGKMLSFIDSVSSVNQKRVQFLDADSNRRLWQYHNGFHGEDWERVATKTGHQFINSALRVQADHSQTDLTAEDIANADVLISTSTLEVGIDLEGIEIITQYHAPYDLSSFVQRAGRAGRQAGDSHIITFLAKDGSDKNLFNRADRFLQESVTTPLNPDNKVVEWVHDALYAYYMISAEADSQNRSEREFLEALLSEPGATDLSRPESIDYKPFYRFLQSPERYVSEILNINVANLFTKTPVAGLQTALQEHRKQMQDEIEPIAELLGTDVEAYANANDPEGEMLTALRDRALRTIDVYQDRLTEIDQLYDAADKTAEYHDKLADLRDNISGQDFDEGGDEIIKMYRQYQARLRSIDSATSQLPYQVGGVDPERTYSIGAPQLVEFENFLNDISIGPRDQLRNFRDRWQATHYLNECLNYLTEYHDTTGDPSQSAHAIKHLLRSLYFFHRYLGKRDDAFPDTGDQPDRDVYYVPEQYFDASGTTFTLVEHSADREEEDKHKLSETSLFDFFTKYYPLRTHFTQSGELELFQPPVRQTPTGLQFDFTADRSQVQTTRQAMFSQPDAVPLKQVEDCSGNSGQMILNYCPDCYEVMERYETECPRHGETNRGKLYSDPIIASDRLGDELEEVIEGLHLGSFTMQLRLEGVDIAEYEYGYDGESFFRLGSEPRKRVISIPDGQEIGFEIDTRGLVWKFDEEKTAYWIDRVLDQVNTIRRGSSLSPEEAADIRRHTAAHLLMLVIADVAGVKTDTLRYHIEDEEGEVVVYEQAEGGQGIVDLACDELTENSGKFLDSMLRVSYDPSIIGLQCWASNTFTDSLRNKTGPKSLAKLDTKTLRPIVREFLTGTPETAFIDDEFALITDQLYDVPESDLPSYIENIEQEILSFIDRLDSLSSAANDKANVSVTDSELIEAGQTFAQAILSGERPSSVIKRTPLPLGTSENVANLFGEERPDGCINTLHVHSCTGAIGGNEQSDCLSHVLLQTLRNQLLLLSAGSEIASQINKTKPLNAKSGDSEASRYLSFK